MNAFDASTTTLEKGFTLIEASAGTGKTTTITAIVLRLIVEEGLSLDQILVTTYTELATAELRGRIRDTLRETLVFLRGGKAANEIVSAVIGRAQDRNSAKRRIENAQRVFDDAAIYTIHGFCGRVLADRAFESGALFETELMADPSPILREVAEDFWRSQFYQTPPIISALAANGGLSVEALRELLEETTTNPTLRILPADTDLPALKEEISREWDALCNCYGESATEIDAIFRDLRWAGNQGKFHQKVREHLPLLRQCLTTRRALGDLCSSLGFFSSSKLARQTLNGSKTPRHEFFDRVERILELAPQLGIAMQTHFAAWAKEELPRRKADRQVHSFEDLLTRLDSALRGPRGDELRKSVRQQYAAALIDEFQDTDPVQYSIFAQIYQQTSARVFLIGDPKQSIYGFRGADVFTYIAAAKKSDQDYSLPKNWRSEATLVEAVNEIFDGRDDSFVIDGIKFEPVMAANEADKKPFSIGGRRDQPLQIWLAPDPALGGIAEAVAGEIARLLNDRATIGEKEVTPSDIAVLVSTNFQPAEIQKALARRRIPTVVYSAASVFHSREAKELQVILAAVAEPTRERKVRAAMATDAIGCSAADLEALAADERQWESRLNRFADYHEIWRDDSFVKMIGAIFVKEKVRRRLLGYFDGERRLTNFFHLTELLHRATAENRLGIEGLLLWLAREMEDEKIAREETELRLESDDDAVRIVTIHKSKGLEYPITFCPFAWRAPFPRDFVKFHRDDDLLLDLERSDENKEQQRKETLAESVRHFYVALTRAKHRSYFVWVSEKKKSRSAPAWLFSNASPEKMKEGIPAADVAAAITQRFARSEAIAVVPLPEQKAAVVGRRDQKRPRLKPRIFGGEIDRSWGVASFTSLIRGRQEATEAPDYDAVETEVVSADESIAPAEGIHRFPGGTRAGTCLHLILEELDFADATKLGPLVADKLALFHLEEFSDVIGETIAKMLRVPLGESGFTLSQVPKKARLSELEFTFPVEALTTARLRKAFALAELPLAIDRLRFPPANGFIKGFIDLVFEDDGRFYFADWKSNWLGPSSASYNPESIAAAMAEHYYGLQLSIYTVALHRYLRARLPGYDYESHFGGAFYIFLRGADPANPQKSVFTARPPLAFVEKLDGIFHGRA